MSCFSPPEGYLVGKQTISMPLPSAAFSSALIASGLLSSTPINTDLLGSIIWRRIFAPAMEQVMKQSGITSLAALKNIDDAITFNTFHEGIHFQYLKLCFY